MDQMYIGLLYLVIKSMDLIHYSMVHAVSINYPCVLGLRRVKNSCYSGINDVNDVIVAVKNVAQNTEVLAS